MDVLTGDISSLVYRHVVKNDLQNIALDGQILQVFLYLDGKKNLGQVARSVGMNMTDMRDAIARLIDLDLVETVQRNISSPNRDFFDYLNSQLANAIGPIAGVLIEEEIVEMGHSLSQFPRTRVAELVELLAREIQREEKKTLFKKNMLAKIKQEGY